MQPHDIISKCIFFIIKAISDNNSAVSCSAIICAMKLAYKGIDVAKNWITEITDKLNSYLNNFKTLDCLFGFYLQNKCMSRNEASTRLQEILESVDSQIPFLTKKTQERALLFKQNVIGCLEKIRNELL